MHGIGLFFNKLTHFFHLTFIQLNSKNLADGGPIPTPTKDNALDVTTYNASALPGAKRGDDGSMILKGIEIRTVQIVFASTGREWGVISEEGLHIYSLDDDMIFDPISMSEQEVITPATIEHKLSGLRLRVTPDYVTQRSNLPNGSSLQGGRS
jgi:hypothetical protein